MRWTMRVFAGGVIAALLPNPGLGQSPATPAAPAVHAAATAPLVADLADVHASPHSFYSTYFRAMAPGGGRYTLHQATLVDLISTAYGVERDTILGGPAWLDYDRFDITTRVPADATRDTANLMLRALLAERFKLVAHPEIKPLPAYLLKVPNGAEPKIKRADTQADPPAGPMACQYQMPATPQKPDSPRPTSFSFKCRGVTMEQYAKDLYRMSSFFLNHPIVDATGLKGAWDFDITYGLRPDMGGLEVQAGVEKIGLKLELGTAPQPVVAVESAVEKPTPNPAGTDKALPAPPPPAFDVATIKPSLPEERAMQFRGYGPNQITISGATLQALIGEAYDISGAMVDGPDYITKARWTITGKVVADPDAKGPGAVAGINFDDLRAMLRTLLAERFALKGHSEDRPGDAYVLTAVNPRLKKADPANRTSCTDRPADGKPRAMNAVLDRYISCQNITLDQFAAEIQYYALDYIKSPVLNSTNLPGAYDITLSWSNSRAARAVAVAPPPSGDAGGGGAAAPSDSAATAEPTGAISLPDAMAKQLGLKMVMQKRPIPMLVVDHLTETPTEN